MSGSRHTARIDLVVIVGSQGAYPVARQILAGLPEDLPAAVVYVQHRLASAGSTLRKLLSAATALPVSEPRDGDPVSAGTVHVAAPGARTTIGPDRTFRVAEGRCLGDPLMAAAASVLGPRTLGVVLSGRLRDGAAGLALIKQAGGRGLVQDPSTAVADSMPLAAMATGCYDFVLAPGGILAAMTALVAVPGAADLFSVRMHPVAPVLSAVSEA